MTGLPPSLAGALHVNVTWVMPATPVTPLGASAVVAGVAGADGVEAGPVPTALMALTVNVYAVPLVSPLTVSVVAGDEKVIGDWAIPPIDGVTT